MSGKMAWCCVTITISGPVLNDRKDMLGQIRYEVEHIHKTAFEGIQFDEMIVCNCSDIEMVFEVMWVSSPKKPKNQKTKKTVTHPS